MATAMMSVAQPRRQWHTLRLLKTARMVLLLLDGLLLLAVVSATEAHRSALQAVGRDTAPSIIAAQHIKTAIAGMDAAVANELLTSPEKSAALISTYDAERADAVKSLLSAAENITYGEHERGPIQTLQDGLAMYEDLAQRARDLHQYGKAGGTAELEAYHQAASVTDRSLLPAADALDAANNDVLESTYRSENFRSSGARFSIVFTALLTFVVLLGSQMMLSQRTHRTFNVPLLAATIVVVLAALHAVSAVASSHRDLRVAKEDAFTSVRALWRGRATAYSANSEESRYLLDPSHAAGHESRFQHQAEALAKLPADLTPEQLIAAARERRQVEGFSGLLADEINNVTFPGEREAALTTFTAWERYLAVDREIRRLESAGQHRSAVDLCTGTEPGQSDWAFEQFDRALGSTLAINQSAFEAAVDRGLAALRNLEWETGLAAVLVAVLVFLGFTPRIREYQ